MENLGLKFYETPHKFAWDWALKDLPKEKKFTAFGCFIGAGGSSFGVKLAGVNHLGGVEIDKKQAEIYALNSPT